MRARREAQPRQRVAGRLQRAVLVGAWEDPRGRCPAQDALARALHDAREPRSRPAILDVRRVATGRDLAQLGLLPLLIRTHDARREIREVQERAALVARLDGDDDAAAASLDA